MGPKRHDGQPADYERKKGWIELIMELADKPKVLALLLTLLGAHDVGRDFWRPEPPISRAEIRQIAQDAAQSMASEIRAEMKDSNTQTNQRIDDLRGDLRRSGSLGDASEGRP